jgi:hypothetical protein
LAYSKFKTNKTHPNRKAKAIDPEFAPEREADLSYIPEKPQWQAEKLDISALVKGSGAAAGVP